MNFVLTAIADYSPVAEAVGSGRHGPFDVTDYPGIHLAVLEEAGNSPTITVEWSTSNNASILDPLATIQTFSLAANSLFDQILGTQYPYIYITVDDGLNNQSYHCRIWAGDFDIPSGGALTFPASGWFNNITPSIVISGATQIVSPLSGPQLSNGMVWSNAVGFIVPRDSLYLVAVHMRISIPAGDPAPFTPTTSDWLRVGYGGAPNGQELIQDYQCKKISAAPDGFEASYSSPAVINAGFATSTVEFANHTSIRLQIAECFASIIEFANSTP